MGNSLKNLVVATTLLTGAMNDVNATPELNSDVEKSAKLAYTILENNNQDNFYWNSNWTAKVVKFSQIQEANEDIWVKLKFQEAINRLCVNDKIAKAFFVGYLSRMSDADVKVALDRLQKVKSAGITNFMWQWNDANKQKFNDYLTLLALCSVGNKGLEDSDIATMSQKWSGSNEEPHIKSKRIHNPQTGLSVSTNISMPASGEFNIIENLSNAGQIVDSEVLKALGYNESAVGAMQARITKVLGTEEGKNKYFEAMNYVNNPSADLGVTNLYNLQTKIGSQILPDLIDKDNSSFDALADDEKKKAGKLSAWRLQKLKGDNNNLWEIKLLDEKILNNTGEINKYSKLIAQSVLNNANISPEAKKELLPKLQRTKEIIQWKEAIPQETKDLVNQAIAKLQK